jgi:antitoxin MazE
MRVAKWGNSLALRLPAKVVKELDLAEGDEVELRATGPRTLEIARDDERAWAMRRIREISKPLPPGWKFDRDEANERGGRDEPDEP